MNNSRKKEVKQLKNVKLVIGNGFDLHCHLKTKYKDYFNHDANKNKILKEWTAEMFIKSKDYLDYRIANHDNFWVDFDFYEKANVWDIFFYLNSNTEASDSKDWLWCEIESEMLEWFKYSTDNYKNWDDVFIIIKEGAPYKSENEIAYVLAAFLYKKHNGKFESKDVFYTFLLEELKAFEHNFGIYINELHYGKHVNEYTRNIPITHYHDYAELILDNLCAINNLIRIDDFNYDTIKIDGVYQLINNINGNWEYPIFGIDSNVFGADDIKYIFSKTSRRMEMDMKKNVSFNNQKADNSIIYGHSLNETDYNYFFSLFDELELCNFHCESKVVFAYNMYPEAKPEDIRLWLRNGIFKLFEKYASYKGLNEPTRLLDLLTMQGRVFTYEIPYIDEKEIFGLQ